MKIKYKNKFYYLEDIPLDIGYKAETVTLYDKNSIPVEFPQKCKDTQLIITMPFIDEKLMREIMETDKFLQDLKIHIYLVLPEETNLPSFENIIVLFDKDNEFSDIYGLTIKMEDKETITKALILISKDGAIYYDEYPDDVYQKFNLEKLKRKIISSKEIYNNKGCGI
ncbi:hypothetical protein [Lebetimonas sp. JS032]|uniref:hypothetical protein n=1 Tax=Lebetimonas sp. JS032 TaxID=990070 RepID=UPI000463A838|nr:hypothetical protein [Lebetimonas sp. JS032]